MIEKEKLIIDVKRVKNMSVSTGDGINSRFKRYIILRGVMTA